MLKRVLVLLLAAWVALPALGRVSPGNGYWWDEKEEFRVQTVAGPVRVQRDFAGTQWQMNARWNAITIEHSLSDGSVQRINRDMAQFVQVGDGFTFGRRTSMQKQDVQVLLPTDAQGVAPADLNATTPTATLAGGLATQRLAGYRWRYRDGRWMDYDLYGRLVSYGDRNDVRVWLEYGSGLEMGLLKQVRDHFGRVVVRYEWQEGPVGVVSGAGGLAIPGQNVGQWRMVGATETLADGRPGRRVHYDYLDLGGPNNPYNVWTISKATDVAGGEYSFAYDKVMRLSATTDPLGRVQRLEYYPGGARVKRLTESDGTVTDYSYDYGKLKQEFYQRSVGPDLGQGKRIEERWYNRDGKLVRLDINGVTQKRALIDDANNSTRTTDSQNLTLTEQRDSFDNPTKTTYPDGSVKRASWSPVHGQLLEEVDEAGVKTRYDYDDKGNLIRKTEAVGLAEARVTEYENNAFGQLIRKTRKGGVVTLPSGDPVTVPDVVTTYRWDDRGNLVGRTDPEGGTTQVSFNNFGRPVSLIDAAGRVWRYEWNAKEFVLAIQNPLGERFSFSYDAVDQLVQITDPNNQKYGFTYDAAGRFAGSINPLGYSRRNEYDAAGRLSQEIDEAGNPIRRYAYLADGQLASVTDGNGNTTRFDYADSSNSMPTTIYYPTFSRKLSRNGRNLVTRVEDQLDAQTSYVSQNRYDAKGQLIQSTDRNGNVTAYRWDGLGRLLESTDALGGKTRYGYDTRDNLIYVTDALGNTTRYGYDRNDRKTSESRPLGETQTYAYDPVGNLIRYQDAKGNVLTYTFDAANRRIEEHHTPAGATSPSRGISYQFDALGNLTGYQDSQGNSAAFTLDALGRRTAENLSYGSLKFSLGTTYSETGQKASQTWPDGLQVRYRYDANQRLKDVILPDGSITVAQRIWNTPAQISYPGGGSRNQGYDALMRLTAIQAGRMDYRYSYDPESNIVGKATEHGNYSYGYDKLYRLTRADNPSPLSNEAYTYDPLGNRLTDSRTNGFLSTNTWTYNGNNQLLQHFNQQGQAVSNRYDENGSLVQKISASGDTKDNQQFAYDAQNRLTKVKDKDGNPVASYQYDPFGHRIKKTVYREPANHPLAQPKTVWFIYAEEGLTAEADANGNITAEYGWQPDGTWGTNPVFLRTARTSATSPETFYYQNDHLGTPQQLLDATGAVVWQANATSFGETQVLAGNQVENNLRFPGQYGDAETGMHQNWFRDYLSAGGRYGESDPIGLDAGMNTYSYAGGAPTTKTDPHGLSPTGSGSVTGNGGQRHQCDGDDCKQTFLDCMAQCIRAYDPLNDESKIGLAAIGGTFPKSWVGLPRGLGGASPMTTVPSATAHALGGGGAGTLGGAARGLGRLASPVWIGYGVYLFGMEGYCAASCANNKCAH